LPRLVLALSLVALAGCATAEFRRAKARDSIDGWRAFLASHADRSEEIDHAHERLEKLSWQAALAENTARAYRRFAEDFPDSTHAEEAEGRLAALRYRRAERGAAGGLTVFLEDEPSGPLAEDARAKLAELEWKAAVAAKGLAPIELYLARFPDGPHLAEARRLADTRAFEAAREEGMLGLSDYVAAHPDGAHRGEAEDQLFAARLGALIDEERFDEAASALRAGGRLPGHDALAQKLAAARQRSQLASAAPIAGLPRAQLEKLQEQAFMLERPDRAAVAQLAAGLEEPDPASRWRAATALGATGSVWALDPLLAAASGSHFWKVRLAAARAVAELVSGWPESVRQAEVAQRVLALRPLVASAELSDRLGLLEEAGGDVTAARAAFAQSRRYAVLDLLAMAEGMALAQKAGDAAAHLALAHDLVEGAARYADDRTRDEALPPLLADRQLCGLVDLAQLGVAALAGAGAEAAVWLPPARAQAERLSEALAEVERRAAAEDTSFAGCAVDGKSGSNLVAAAVARRLAAVAALAAELTPGPEGDVARALLEEAAAHDGSKDVRTAAGVALASGK